MKIFKCVVLCFIFCTTVALSAQTQQPMTDPFFGISYDPGIVKFEQAPPTVNNACSQIHDERTWVFAHLKNEDVEYFIVSGFARVCPDGSAPCAVAPNITGTIVALRESKCTAEAADGFHWQKNDPLWNLSEASLDLMARDAIRKYIKAFGGRTQFLERLPPKALEYSDPIMRKQIELIENESSK